jgi:hypothetical protein
MTASSVTTAKSVITFTFADPAPVKASESYALVLSCDGNGHIAWSNRTGTARDCRSFLKLQRTWSILMQSTNSTFPSPRSFGYKG